MKTVKLLCTILCVGFLSGVILSGCSDSSKSENGTPLVDSLKKSGIGPLGNYWSHYFYGSPYAQVKSGTTTTPANFDLTTEYKNWKSNFVDGTGLPSNQLRVHRDIADSYDTPSEAQGYGMLLAVYMQDQDTFDKLYAFTKAHFINANSLYPNSYSANLMHWAVSGKGIHPNVSEFDVYPLDASLNANPLPATGSNGRQLAIRCQTAVPPHGLAFGNLIDGSVLILRTKEWYHAYYGATTTDGQDTYQYVVNYIKGLQQTNYNYGLYYPMFAEDADRQPNSATDADEDIAAALAVAAKIWGSSTNYNYLTEAQNMINDIEKYDFGSPQGTNNYTLKSQGKPEQGFIFNGNAWGGQNGWNPSYVTFAYYKNIFAKVCPASAWFWASAYETMSKEMGKIIKYQQQQGAFPGLCPDFCDTTSGTPVKSHASSRNYYRNAINYPYNAYGAPSPTWPLDSSHYQWITPHPMNVFYDDGTDACHDPNSYTMQQSSFNLYYDAIRVPWRTAVDCSWSGWAEDPSGNVMKIVNGYFNFFNGGANNPNPQNHDSANFMPNSPSTLSDGYSILGGAWNWADRDGFNYSVGGQWNSPEFRSMMATAEMSSLSSNSSANTTGYWENLMTISQPVGPGLADTAWTYFGRTLRMLSLVYLTGNFLNPYELDLPPSGSYVRISNRYISSGSVLGFHSDPNVTGYLNIEQHVTHTVECSDFSSGYWNNPDAWSDVWNMVKNSDGYYTFQNKWQPKSYACYLHTQDHPNSTDVNLPAEWDTCTTGSLAGRNPDPNWGSAWWSIIPSPNKAGYYLIKNYWSGLYLTAVQYTVKNASRCFTTYMQKLPATVDSSFEWQITQGQ